MINNLIYYKLLPVTDFQSPHPYARATRSRACSALRRDRKPVIGFFCSFILVRTSVAVQLGQFLMGEFTVR